MSAATEVLVQLWVLLIGVFLAWRWKRQQHIAKCLSAFPGFRFTLPIIGDSVHLLRDPATLLVWGCQLFKTYGQNIRFWMCSSPVVAMTRPEDVEIILSNTKNVYKPLHYYRMLEYFFGRGLITLVGDEWRRHRKAITPSFHFGVLERYVDIFLERAEELNKELAKFSGGGAFDVFPLVGACSNETICATALGWPADDNSRAERLDFIRDMDTAFNIIQYRVLHPWFMSDLLFSAFSSKARVLYAAEAKIKNYAERAIQCRKNALAAMAGAGAGVPADEADDDVGLRQRYSFLDLMLTNGRTLDASELLGEVRTMIAAQQTSSVLTCFALQMLAMHPDIQEEAFAELKSVWAEPDLSPHQRLQSLHFMERVIKEALRLFPSVPIFAREMMHDTKLSDGSQVPAGCIAATFVFGIHRDARNYPDPLRFDPDRFLPENCSGRHPFAYIPFGAGSRNCIGQKYANLQIKAVLSTILRRYEVLAPESGPRTVADVKTGIDTFLTCPDGHNIRLINRSSAVAGA